MTEHARATEMDRGQLLKWQQWRSEWPARHTDKHRHHHRRRRHENGNFLSRIRHLGRWRRF